MFSNQWTVISFGTLALLRLGYYYRQLGQQQQQYKQKISEFEKCYQEMVTRTKPIYNQTYLQTNITNLFQYNNKNVCLMNIKPRYNEATFKHYQRQRSIYYDNNYSLLNKKFLQNQMGGSFEFNFKGDTVKCELNDVHISTKLLQQKKEPVHLFKGLNELQPIVCAVTTVLSSNALLSVYGKLSYEDNVWRLEPYFLTPDNQLSDSVIEFYNQKIDSATIYKFTVVITGLVIGYFAIFKPLKKLFNKKKVPEKDKIFLTDIDYFKNMDQIVVRGEGLLNCEQCRTKSVQIVYECGHLALCEECHEANNRDGARLCPLCKKPSAKFMKIYMA